MHSMAVKKYNVNLMLCKSGTARPEKNLQIFANSIFFSLINLATPFILVELF
jgi:hypothetical protein